MSTDDADSGILLKSSYVQFEIELLTVGTYDVFRRIVKTTSGVIKGSTLAPKKEAMKKAGYTAVRCVPPRHTLPRHFLPVRC